MVGMSDLYYIAHKMAEDMLLKKLFRFVDSCSVFTERKYVFVKYYAKIKTIVT